MAKNKKKFKVFLFFLLFIMLVISLIMMYIERIVLPNGAEVLQSYAETNMFEILNSTVSDVIKKHSSEYENLSEIKYTSDGKISSININYKAVNLIKSEIAMGISKKLNNTDDYPVYVPIGAFLNNIYFMGKGPSIKFVLVQRGCVHTDFSSEFKGVGVNQTLHTMKINLDADVALMLPFYDTHTIMKTSAILSETIINGDIPSYYLTKEN